MAIGVRFADTHCHLCCALDDGPQTESDALEMCQQSWNEGIRAITVTAHQNERWTLTPDQIIQSTNQLQKTLEEIACDIQLAPVGEVMISPETLEQFVAGDLLTYGNHGKHLLVEHPHGLFLDIRELASQLIDAGVIPVIAHAERYPELLHQEVHLRELLEIGCLIQLSSNGITHPSGRKDQKAIKHWLNSGYVHVIGSDAHSPRRRRPRMREASMTIAKWTNETVAHTICWTNGIALLNGDNVQTIPATQPSRKWFSFK